MPLNILKASAGSGKTFNLTRTYISYCLDPKKSIDFNHILAITFTKKATAEMKNRILSELFILTSNTSKSQHLDYFLNTLNISVETLQTRSQKLLFSILQDYHHFTISTIDSFFSGLYQSVVLDLFKEAKRDVYLDSNIILERATEALIHDINSKNPLAGILQSMIKERLSQGNGYNINSTIQKLGNQLFRDEFTFLRNNHIFQRLSDDFYQLLLTSIEDIENKIKDFQTILTELLDKVNMTGLDFSYSKGSFMSSAMNKDILGLHVTKRFNDYDTVDKWFSKKDREDKEIMVAPVFDDLMNTLTDFHGFVFGHIEMYKSYLLIRSNYPSFKVLSFLDQYIEQYCEQEGIITLNEINAKLYSKIQNQDAPILFEKLGQRFKSILIDEFQDTSLLQWNNLQPLIENTLYEGYPVLVVGDVKQSIYRFRGGDWRIMEYAALELQSKFNDPDNPEKFGITDTLPHNWRSLRAVVETNNELFATLSHYLTDRLREYAVRLALGDDEAVKQMVEAPQHIFNSIHQAIPDRKDDPPGYVTIEYHPYSGNKGEMNQEVLIWLEEKIEKLGSLGIRGKNIGILCNRKSECQLIGSFFSEKAESNPIYHFSASDSLQLGKNEGLILLITALKIRSNIQVSINIQTLYTYVLKSKQVQWDISLMPDKTTSFSEFPEIEELLAHPIEQLYSFFEAMIQVLYIKDQVAHQPFLLIFLELVKKFEKEHGSDAKKFIREWEEKFASQSIQSGSGEDKIQLMTMHKSKGLEFHTVLLPFGNWDIESVAGKTDLWVHSDRDELVDVAGLLPLTYSEKNMVPSYYTKDYFVEYVFNVVDNLNLLYVAMTRPKANLLIRINEKEKKSDTKTSDKPLTNTVQFYKSAYPSIEIEHYVKGQLSALPQLEEVKEGSAMVLEDFTYRKKSLAVVYQGMYQHQSDAIQRGVILHHILQYIHSKEDISTAVLSSEMDGVIRSEDEEFWKNELIELLELPDIAPYYSNHWKVYNEKTMILPSGDEFRPDRVQETDTEMVVIDYKTGKHYSRYIHQVKHYVSVLAQMVNKPVSGYLLYIDEGKIVSV